jgi:hypothetical protein
MRACRLLRKAARPCTLQVIRSHPARPVDHGQPAGRQGVARRGDRGSGECWCRLVHSLLRTLRWRTSAAARKPGRRRVLTSRGPRLGCWSRCRRRSCHVLSAPRRRSSHPCGSPETADTQGRVRRQALRIRSPLTKAAEINSDSIKQPRKPGDCQQRPQSRSERGFMTRRPGARPRLKGDLGLRESASH